jgi:hypothetical protein
MVVFVFLFFTMNVIFAQDIETSLITEQMLHPLDSYTAYTFHRGEWAYNFPVLALSPGWMWWGITDWLSAELDLECWLGGVPSFNFRFAFSQQQRMRPAVAYETMFQYLPREIDLMEGYETLRIVRKGSSWYHHINTSWYFLKRCHLHFSFGGTYSRYLLIENANRSVYYGTVFRNLISPDISLGFDWRITKWLSFHTSGSYGTTFVYLDNVPRKYQFTYGFRVAPFWKFRWAILRNFRIEFASIIFHFPEAKETISLPVPIFPYLYWQWGGR